MADNIMEVKRRLLQLLQNVDLVNAYLRKFGPVITAKNISDIKYGGKGAMSIGPVVKPPTAKMPAVPVTPVNDAGEQDPIYEMTVNCPVCGRSKITSFEMRAKSQQVTQTIYLVPEYTGAGGYATVDYSRFAVAVCPDCLFASPDKKNFNYPSFDGKGEEKSTLSVGVLLNLKDATEERKQLLPKALGNPEYFGRNRSAEAAIDSYRLAMARAQAEAELMQPYAHFKIGSYLLKIAYIQKSEGQDNTETMAEALKYFEKAFQKSECQNEEIEMQVIYLTVAINIRLRDLTKANSYLTVYSKLLAERMEQKKKHPSLTTQWIEKWQDKARFLWEERENPEYFDK